MTTMVYEAARQHARRHNDLGRAAAKSGEMHARLGALDVCCSDGPAGGMFICRRGSVLFQAEREGRIVRQFRPGRWVNELLNA